MPVKVCLFQRNVIYKKDPFSIEVFCLSAWQICVAILNLLQNEHGEMFRHQNSSSRGILLKYCHNWTVLGGNALQQITFLK